MKVYNVYKTQFWANKITVHCYKLIPALLYEMHVFISKRYAVQPGIQPGRLKLPLNFVPQQDQMSHRSRPITFLQQLLYIGWHIILKKKIIRNYVVY